MIDLKALSEICIACRHELRTFRSFCQQRFIARDDPYASKSMRAMEQRLLAADPEHKAEINFVLAMIIATTATSAPAIESANKETAKRPDRFRLYEKFK